MLATIKQELRDSDFHRFQEIIFQQTGISLDDGKKTLLQSRLQKRLRALEIESYGEYFDFVKDQGADGDELQKMINRVTTNKTHFFREEHHFDYLRDVVFSTLIQQAEQGLRPKRLRIWSAACSSGEEPYTLAIAVRETFKNRPDWDIRILASDIDTDVLGQAEKGIYHEDSVEDLDHQRVKQNFMKGSTLNAGKVQVRKELRDLVAFRNINFADSQWPVNAKFDAIFCRNVLIYFNETTQDQLVRRLSDYLQPDGYLFIGHSESLARTKDTYTRVGPTVFQLTDSARKNASQVQANSNDRPQAKPEAQRQAYSPPDSTTAIGNSPHLKRLIVGDVFASETPKVLTTTLGSCIATCLYDDVTRIGGMNHFALPTDKGSARLQSNFGVHAMELLINEMLNLGAAKHRMKAKVFGAANLTHTDKGNAIGISNETFIRGFLETEGIPLMSELLGGDSGMQVLFETATGRARVKLLDRGTVLEATKQTQTVEMPGADITLF